MTDQLENATGTERYPIDFESVKIGDFFDASFFERVYGVRPGDPKFRLYQMKLKEQIEDLTPFLPCTEGNGVRVMTWKEADDWTEARGDSHVRGLVRTVKRRARIDRSEFDEKARSIAESRDRKWSSVALAASAERRKQRKLELLREADQIEG